MSNPVIGVPANTTWINAIGSMVRHVTAIGNAMIEPILDAGGTPTLLSNLTPTAHIPDIVRSLDGILLPGGQDVSPSAYGQECRINYDSNVMATGKPYHRPPMMAPDPRRDEFEIALYHAAKKAGLPILGICRGMQLINIAEGGTLHQEVADVAKLAHELDSNGYNHHHGVNIRESSRMHDVFQATSTVSPSMHHQAVDRVGSNLVVSGTATDGVIEFIEAEDPSLFVIGIQGDVERARRNVDGFDKLYRRFVDLCRSRRAARGAMGL